MSLSLLDATRVEPHPLTRSGFFSQYTMLFLDCHTPLGAVSHFTPSTSDTYPTPTLQLPPAVNQWKYQPVNYSRQVGRLQPPLRQLPW